MDQLRKFKTLVDGLTDSAVQNRPSHELATSKQSSSRLSSVVLECGVRDRKCYAFVAKECRVKNLEG